MSNRCKLQGLSVVVCAVALTSLLTTTAHAVPVVFTVDPAHSNIFVNTNPAVSPSNPTGDVTTLLGVTVMEQTPGSGTDSYSGTIAADETGGVLTFTGGSNIVGALNPAGPPPYTPTTPSGTDNYGIQTVTAVPGFGVVSVALRNGVFDITSGIVSNNTIPSGVNLQVLPGGFAATPLGPSSTAGAGADSTGVAASLTTAGGIETLILPVTRITGSTAHVVLIGEIVATRQVPEPSTFVLAGVAMAGLASIVWRKRSK